MFGQKATRGLSALAFDSLTISRGEQIRRPAQSQPHHQVCPVCGFDRWDGVSDHRWGAKRFAQRTCFGPAPKAGTPAAAPKGPTNPLIEELRAFAGQSDLLDAVEPEEAPVPDVRHGFQILDE